MPNATRTPTPVDESAPLKTQLEQLGAALEALGEQYEALVRQEVRIGALVSDSAAESTDFDTKLEHLAITEPYRRAVDMRTRIEGTYERLC